MKHLEKGIDFRKQESKVAFMFCDLNEDMLHKNIEKVTVLEMFSKWFTDNKCSDRADFIKTETIVYMILAHNGYLKFL